jgi:short chain dehydrogenase
LKLFDAGAAIVTGARSGIGRATALIAATEGLTVATSDRNEARVAGVVTQIRAQGGAAESVVLDVGNYAAVDEALAQSLALGSCRQTRDRRPAPRQPRANAVAPGGTITARTRAHLEQSATLRGFERSPLGRPARAGGRRGHLLPAVTAGLARERGAVAGRRRLFGRLSPDRNSAETVVR